MKRFIITIEILYIIFTIIYSIMYPIPTNFSNLLVLVSVEVVYFLYTQFRSPFK